MRAATNNTFANFAPACICYSGIQSGFTFVDEYANKIFEIIRVPRVQFRLNQNAIIWLYIDLMFLVVSGIERYHNLEFKVPIRNIAADSCDGEKSPVISLITRIFALHNYFKHKYFTLILFLDWAQFVRDTQYVHLQIQTPRTSFRLLFSRSSNLVVRQICSISNFDLFISKILE